MASSPSTSPARICAPRPSLRATAGAVGRGAFLTAWYTVVTAPDAQAFLHRAFNSHTGAPFWRVVDGARSIAQLSTLPLAAVATALGRTRIARISTFAIFANPPTLLLTALIAHDIANFLFRKFRQAASAVMRISPLSRTEAQEENGTAVATTVTGAATASSAAQTARPKITGKPTPGP